MVQIKRGEIPAFYFTGYEVFRYQLLSRMKMDCEFFLGFGNRMEKYLWAGNVVFQIECMKSIWDSFPADGKPEWLTVEQIENYERRMAG